MGINRKTACRIFLVLIFLTCVIFSACSAHTAKRAGEGAAYGAVVGAAGNMVTALVFGGDVGRAAARGAVFGATSGAVAGGIRGAQENQAIEERQSREIETLKTRLGQDAFDALTALAECRHDAALVHARAAAVSSNQNYALAGLWLEVITYADDRQESMARQRYPDLIAKDTDIGSEAQAEEAMRKALQELTNIRKEYNLPGTCG